MRDIKSLKSLIKYLVKGNQLIYLEYPISGEVKYSPPNGIPIFEKLFIKHKKELIFFERMLHEYLEELKQIPIERKDESGPFYKNKTLSALDAASLFSIIRHYKPRKIIEIGSGNSTKFISKGIQSNLSISNHQSTLVSIDPNPRSFVDTLCDEIYRCSLENINLNIFDTLVEGDFIFFDGSHRCYQNNDVSFFFLEVLPRLKKGVMIGVHDIWLPYDYPKHWVQRFYNEQIVLGVYLLGRQENLDLIASNMYASQSIELKNIYQDFLNNLGIDSGREFRDGGLIVFKS